jgi:hypothetical protein
MASNTARPVSIFGLDADFDSGGDFSALLTGFDVADALSDSVRLHPTHKNIKNARAKNCKRRLNLEFFR